MIRFRDIEDAFLFVSSDQPFMNIAVINRKTGKTYYKSELLDNDDFPADVESEDYIVIPHKNDLDLGRALVFEFVSQHLPQKMDRVNEMFHRRGAYRAFKAMLESLRMLEKWYAFEDEHTKSALRKWCEENELQIDA